MRQYEDQLTSLFFQKRLDALAHFERSEVYYGRLEERLLQLIESKASPWRRRWEALAFAYSPFSPRDTQRALQLIAENTSCVESVARRLLPLYTQVHFVHRDPILWFVLEKQIDPCSIKDQVLGDVVRISSRNPLWNASSTTYAYGRFLWSALSCALREEWCIPREANVRNMRFTGYRMYGPDPLDDLAKKGLLPLE